MLFDSVAKIILGFSKACNITNIKKHRLYDKVALSNVLLIVEFEGQIQLIGLYFVKSKALKNMSYICVPVPSVCASIRAQQLFQGLSPCQHGTEFHIYIYHKRRHIVNH